eukprot:6182894-Pleurochrysis_carterae.AAC.1
MLQFGRERHRAPELVAVVCGKRLLLRRPDVLVPHAFRTLRADNRAEAERGVTQQTPREEAADIAASAKAHGLLHIYTQGTNRHTGRYTHR